MLPDSQSKGKDSVDLIRDSLFAIQVEKPWLLLQFGNSDTEESGLTVWKLWYLPAHQMKMGKQGKML